MCEEALRRARTAAAMARAAPWDEVESGAKNVGGRCFGGEVRGRGRGQEGAEGARTEAREPTRPLICLSAALVALSTAR